MFLLDDFSLWQFGVSRINLIAWSQRIFGFRQTEWRAYWNSKMWECRNWWWNHLSIAWVVFSSPACGLYQWSMTVWSLMNFFLWYRMIWWLLLFWRSRAQWNSKMWECRTPLKTPCPSIRSLLSDRKEIVDREATGVIDGEATYQLLEWSSHHRLVVFTNGLWQFGA